MWKDHEKVRFSLSISNPNQQVKRFYKMAVTCNRTSNMVITQYFHNIINNIILSSYYLDLSSGSLGFILLNKK